MNENTVALVVALFSLVGVWYNTTKKSKVETQRITADSSESTFAQMEKLYLTQKQETEYYKIAFKETRKEFDELREKVNELSIEMTSMKKVYEHNEQRLIAENTILKEENIYLKTCNEELEDEVSELKGE